MKRMLEKTGLASPRRIQDPYSLRCTPNVHGAVHGITSVARNVLEKELCSPSENPIVLVKKNKVVHQCGFHGIHVALVSDMLAEAYAVLGNLSERRGSQLLDSSLTGLPPFLAGRKSPTGFMLVHYLMAAQAAKLRHLATPLAVHNIPTSLLQEDYVSMSAEASLRLEEAFDTLMNVFAGEALLALRAYRLRKKKTCPLLKIPRIEGEYSRVMRRIADEMKKKVEGIISSYVEQGGLLDRAQQPLQDI